MLFRSDSNTLSSCDSINVLKMNAKPAARADCHSTASPQRLGGACSALQRMSAGDFVMPINPKQCTTAASQATKPYQLPGLEASCNMHTRCQKPGGLASLHLSDLNSAIRPPSATSQCIWLPGDQLTVPLLSNSQHRATPPAP